MIYLCLVGTAASDILKEAGIKVGMKGLEAEIKKIPGAVLVKINQKIGFRFITRAGEKGVINLMKLVPLAGGVIGGSIDVATTFIISRNAIKLFIENDDPEDALPSDEDVVELESISKLIEVEKESNSLI